MGEEIFDDVSELLFYLRVRLRGREDDMVGLMMLLILGVRNACGCSK